MDSTKQDCTNSEDEAPTDEHEWDDTVPDDEEMIGSE